MTITSEAYVGIDVGKTWLDVARWGEEGVWRVANDEEGVAKVVERVAGWATRLIAVEASGGYEQLLVQSLLLKSQPVAVVNPTPVRALSKATGKLAKTDEIDARLIAEYAFKIQPEVLAPKAAAEIRLTGRITRREQWVEMRAAEQNRLGTVTNCLHVDIREHIEWLSTRIQEFEVQIQAVIDSLPEWQSQAKCLDSIPGVGFITAATVMSEMPELGQLLRLWLGWPPSTRIAARNGVNDAYWVVAKAFGGGYTWPACLPSGLIQLSEPCSSA